jgi:uncharacterized membrane protein YfcA
VDNQALALLFRFALHAAAINEHRVDSRETRRLNFLFVLAVGLVAGTLSGIVGTGSSIMLMPVLLYQYGPKQAVPIMAIMDGIMLAAGASMFYNAVWRS